MSQNKNNYAENGIISKKECAEKGINKNFHTKTH